MGELNALRALIERATVSGRQLELTAAGHYNYAIPLNAYRELAHGLENLGYINGGANQDVIYMFLKRSRIAANWQRVANRMQGRGGLGTVIHAELFVNTRRRRGFFWTQTIQERFVPQTFEEFLFMRSHLRGLIEESLHAYEDGFGQTFCTHIRAARSLGLDDYLRYLAQAKRPVGAGVTYGTRKEVTAMDFLRTRGFPMLPFEVRRYGGRGDYSRWLNSQGISPHPGGVYLLKPGRSSAVVGDAVLSDVPLIPQ